MSIFVYLSEAINIDSEETNLEAETNKRNTVKNKPLNNEIPSMSTSNFRPFEHSYPEHKSSVLLPSNDLESENPTIFYIFTKFFSSHLIETIVQNTNIYAYSQITKAKSTITSRKWEPLTVSEFKIWLAIIIYGNL